MTDKLHQINVTYSGKEDRLLLKVTTQQGDEFRIWLTRRFTGLLFSVLNKEMDKHGGAASIGTDQQTKKMFKAGAFEKKFEQEKTTGYPMGKEGFLAYGIKTANTPDGHLLLEIIPEQGPGVTINLNPSLQYMMHNLLSQGLMRAEWDRQITNFRDETSRHVH